MSLGFLGIGVMGLPMASNLARSGKPLVVWNRRPERCEPLRALGAQVAASPSDVFDAADTVILMLASQEAMDECLGRGTPAFDRMVNGTTVVHMGTTSAEYSQGLEADVLKAGGRYVEAPVSGSRKPAEAGQLVGMLAGDPSAVEAVKHHLSPMCKDLFECGPVPSALRMKLSVNLFLITMVTGLCESFHYAQSMGLDTRLFASILDAGPMSSAVSRMKLPKLVESDFSVQASIVDVLKNARLVAEGAEHASVASPMIDLSLALFTETLAQGHGELDMAAVVKAIQARRRSPQAT